MPSRILLKFFIVDQCFSTMTTLWSVEFSPQNFQASKLLGDLRNGGLQTLKLPRLKGTEPTCNSRILILLSSQTWTSPEEVKNIVECWWQERSRSLCLS